MLFQLTANFSPGDARQTQIEHNRRGRGAPEHFDRQTAVRNRLYRITLGFKQSLQGALNSAIIFYY
jgi:hypothetical protein